MLRVLSVILKRMGLAFDQQIGVVFFSLGILAFTGLIGSVITKALN